jgi:hypothetical protein
LAAARLPQNPPEVRIARYFEAAEIAVREAGSGNSDETAQQQQAEQIYDDASAEVTVLAENGAERTSQVTRHEKAE